MFLSADINREGNWWVIGWESTRLNTNYGYGQQPGPRTGWRIRAWDPPLTTSAAAEFAAAIDAALEMGATPDRGQFNPKNSRKFSTITSARQIFRWHTESNPVEPAAFHSDGMARLLTTRYERRAAVDLLGPFDDPYELSALEEFTRAVIA
jgi:hypothetical protein